MNNIISLEIKSVKIHHAVQISNQIKQYLKQWKKFIRTVLERIIMNLLHFWSPNHKIIVEAFEHDLESFNTSVQAWRWITIKYLSERSHINLLEFITQLMQMWFDIMDERIQSEDCMLAVVYHISAMGWIRR